ncbi:hypothetical protein [Kocuria sp. JC486]|nr:hypothetical protein [Kocuria sp. JC486]
MTTVTGSDGEVVSGSGSTPLIGAGAIEDKAGAGQNTEGTGGTM